MMRGVFGWMTRAIVAGALTALAGCALPHSSLSRPDANTGDRVAIDAADVVVRPDAPPPDSVGCNPGEMRCNGTCVPVDTATRCGRCDNDCTMLFGVVPSGVSCNAGTCSLACQPRYADCNGSPDDGCETDISTPSNCGACGATCGAMAPMCSSASGASFACATGCSGATNTLCGAMCIDVTTDPANCGSCGGACPMPANARATCTAGACGFVCDAGYHRCGDHCAADSSLTECGAACSPCAAPGAITSCSSGSCTIVGCAATTQDCNGVLADGCETNLATPSNCGMCGRSCAVANAAPSCTAGACGIASCTPGFANCNSLDGDGCETSLDSPNACGSCANACPVPPNGRATCTAGACGIACNMGYVPSAGGCVLMSSTCGNRMLESGETCDDGNSANGDGCNATCQLEQTVPADGCPGTPIIARRGTQWYRGTTVGATNDFSCTAGATGPDRVYDLTTADGGSVVIELVPAAGYDTIFQARIGACPGTFDSFCVDAAPPGGSEFVTTAVTTAGARYTVVIDGYGPSAGAYAWRITIM